MYKTKLVIKYNEVLKIIINNFFMNLYCLIECIFLTFFKLQRLNSNINQKYDILFADQKYCT